MRVRYGAARHRKKKRLLKAARGFRGSPGKRWRLAQEAVRRSRVFAFRDRRARKRNFRQLWVTRLSAACTIRGIMYSRFIFALQQAGIELNRKMLSEIAIHNPEEFDAIVEQVRPHLPQEKAVA